MLELPTNLRDLIVEKTHGKVMDSIKFFREKAADFKVTIVS